MKPGCGQLGSRNRTPSNLITLDDIARYQRFDADWVSFEDDTAVAPVVADLRS